MSTDAELVAGILAGDREAFAAVYDRYADRLYDFCHSVLRDRHEAQDAVQDTFVLVAQRLSQLKDPERLRPWLYAVARSVALRRTRVRKRIVLDEVSDVVDPDAGPQQAAEVAALRELVWSAAAGLSERDRALLDLHLRQGLDGAELGEAVGVSASHAYVLLTRLRDQVERSLGALLIARRGRDDCPELKILLSNWDGRFSPLLRKRVARHVDNCQVCGERRRTMVSPLALLAAVPLMTAPLALRDQVLEQVEVELVAHEQPTRPARPSRLPMAAAAVTLLIAVGLATVWDQTNNTPGTPLAQDVVPGTTTSPTGPTTAPSVLPPSVGSASGTPTTTTTTNRGGPPQQPTTTTPPTTTTTTTTDPPPDTARPEIVRQSAAHPRIFNDRRCKPITNPVTATVVDNVGVTSATVHWIGPGEGSGAKPMTLDGGTWRAELGPFGSGGVQWYVTATDAAGNAGRGPTDKFSVAVCPAG